ncbi:hypothetical protein M407DRAFT_207714 [Tulasnella calospora MUT 4182]|uniref:Myb-like domain-containing protein n=1 Tax=Tulasnella calospora MUT 4182 TaxID=1051891 RepID=A0A0C3PMR5_9AGAM|nr:hypothetical protein M407DRAFT_207714 [Tulasnella calospora MUT 4182]
MTVTTRSHTKVQDGSRGSSKSREREGERQPTNHTSSPPPSPPSAPINQEEEDLQIPWSRSPSQEQSNEAHSSTEESEDDEEPESVGHGRGRGWLPWQDRLLITEAKALRTFLAPHGSKSQAWEELAAVLKEKSLGKVTRSGPTCKARFSKLIKAHRANETRSLQATGKNEEIDEHVQSLTEIVQLLDDANLETERATESAWMKIEMERRVGLEMRMRQCETWFKPINSKRISVNSTAQVFGSVKVNANGNRMLQVSTTQILTRRISRSLLARTRGAKP